MLQRCAWPMKNDLMIAYHDTEWGTPLHDDQKLFEFLVLDAFQAGLSWAIVLKKRENFRKAFDNYDIPKIAKYNKRKIESLLKDEGIIRNRLKITATIDNAKAFINIQKEFGSFDKHVWQFVSHRPIQNKWRSLKELPAKTEISDIMSKDLKTHGFKFVGSTICYSFMQAAGMVNDHILACFRHKELK